MSLETVAFLEDVYFTAKIRETARKAEKDVRFVRDLTGLDKRLNGPAPALVLIDLTAESLQPLDLIRQIKSQPGWSEARMVAYSSHKRAELMEEASQLGVDVVLPKSSFTQQLQEILMGSAV